MSPRSAVAPRIPAVDHRQIVGSQRSLVLASASIGLLGSPEEVGTDLPYRCHLAAAQCPSMGRGYEDDLEVFVEDDRHLALLFERDSYLSKNRILRERPEFAGDHSRRVVHSRTRVTESRTLEVGVLRDVGTALTRRVVRP